MTPRPLVSAVIPFFNSSTLPIAVESVLAQTYQNLEVVLVDDGSTTKVDFPKSKKIYYFKVPHSGGPAKPRNFGVSKAKGNLVAFLDSDDRWLPNKIDEQIKKIDEGYDLSYSDGEVVSESGNKIRSSFMAGIETPSGKVFPKLFLNNFIPTSSVLMKKTLFLESGGFDESGELKVGEDYDLWLRLSKSCQFGFVPKKLFIYQEREKSLSNIETSSSQRFVLKAVKNNLDFAKQTLPAEVFHRRLHSLYHAIATAEREKDFGEFLKFKLLEKAESLGVSL